MKLQCPHCLHFHIRPAEHRWFEAPLVLFLVQPYQCRQCGRRSLHFRWPDLPFGSRSLIAR